MLGQPFGRGDFSDPASDAFEEAAIVELSREIAKRNVMLFVGSGLSVSEGRPTWKELVERAVAKTLARIELVGDEVRHHDGADMTAYVFPKQKRARIERLRTYIEKGQSDHYLQKLEACRELFEIIGVDTRAFDALIKTIIDAKKKPAIQGVIDEVLELTRSKRFVSLNYDREIERHFREEADLEPWPVGGAAATPPSGTGFAPQRFTTIATGGATTEEAQASCAALIRLATNSPIEAKGVFHLHGVVDPEVEEEGGGATWRHSALVVGERDYQNLYLRDAPDQRLYRRALEMTLRGNTVLFVGVGLAEEDVLRPLRQLTTELGHPSQRSFFALFTMEAPEIDDYLGKYVDDDDLAAPEAEVAPEDERSELRKIFRRARYEQRHHQYKRYGIRLLFAQNVEESAALKALAALKKADATQIAPAKVKIMAVADKIRQWLAAKNTNIDPIPINDAGAAIAWFISATVIKRCVELRQSQKRWWENWKIPPRRRAASFRRQGGITAKAVGDSAATSLLANMVFADPQTAPEVYPARTRHQLVERQYAYYFPQIVGSQIDALVADVAARCDGRRRVVCVRARNGAGAGAVVHRLLYANPKKGAEHPLTRLARGFFSNDVKPAQVRGFVASTHFSSEFMSVLEATTEFIERVAAGREDEPADDLAPEKPRRPPLARLEEAVAKLSTEGSGRRIVIVYAGVERIAGRNGVLSNDGVKGYLVKLAAHAQASDGRIALLLFGRTGAWYETFAREILGPDAPLFAEAPEPGGVATEKGVFVDLRRTTLDEWRESAETIEPPEGWTLDEAAWRALVAGAQPTLETLYDVVHGHRFAICVALKGAFELDPERPGERLETLTRRIEAKAPRRQAEHVVELVVKELENKFEPPKGAGDRDDAAPCGPSRWPRRAIWRSLVVLSLAPAPTELCTLRHLVFDPEAQDFMNDDKAAARRRGDTFIAAESALAPETQRALLKPILETLERIGLIYRFVARTRHVELARDYPDAIVAADFERYAVHSVVRRLVRRRLGQRPSPAGDSPYFELSGYISGSGSLPSFDAPGLRLANAFADRLVAAREESETVAGDAPAAGWSGEQVRVFEEEAARMRTAVHMMRASIPLVQIMRDEAPPGGRTQDAATRMDDHRRRVIQILDGVRRAQHQRFDAKPDGAARGKLGVALYADELIWLFNEFGVICLAQGDVIEARSLLDQTWRIAREDYGEQKGHYWSHYKLVRAYVDLELGDIDRARYGFEQVAEENGKPDHLLGSRARGLIGLIHHLRDDRVGARRAYDRAIKIFRHHDRRRALSFFHRLRADLSRREGDFEAAGRDYDLALAAAAEQPDLYHYAVIGKARLALERSTSAIADAIGSLDAAERYARHIGLPRLHGEVLLVRSKMRSALGEYEVAAKSAYRALAIFGKRSLRLRVVSTLEVLAEIHDGAKEEVLARALAETAMEEALARRYVIKHEEVRRFSALPPSDL